MIQTSDEGYIIAGETTSFGNGYDIYLVKTDANGNTLWSKTYGGTGMEYFSSLQKTSDGGYVIAGYTNSFGEGNNDMYIIKTDSQGNSGCYQSNTTTVVDTILTFTYNQPINVTLYGYSGNFTCLIDSGCVENILCLNVGIAENTYYSEDNICCFPNPAKDKIYIKLQKPLQINIYNVLGEIFYAVYNIKQQTVNEIDISRYPKGIYFVKSYDGNKIHTEKIVIQ